MKKFLLALFGFVGVLLVVVLGKTFLISSKQLQVKAVSPPAFRQEAAAIFAKALQIPTISYEEAPADSAAFADLHRHIAVSFPLVDSLLDKQVVNRHSLLYKWEGKNKNLKPILLMAHLDVVPVEPGTEKNWTHPPFSGAIADGRIWGRGALDVKNLVFGILEASEYLLGQGFTPDRTVYFAFGHDEEKSGLAGNKQIADYLQQQGVKFDFVIDEGLFVISGAFPGIDKPVASIGIAEKGFMNVELGVLSQGGHSSNPPHVTNVGILAQALVRIQESPFEGKTEGPVATMLDFIAPEMSMPLKAVFANRWLFDPVIISQMDKGAAKPLLRTTIAPTMLKASNKANVLPANATAVINFRILPGETRESVLAYIKKVVNDDRVLIREADEGFASSNPSVVASVQAPAFNLINKTIRQTFGDVVVAPALFVGATDSKHYLSMADNIYRFNAISLNANELDKFHGTNECITVENYRQIIHFYMQLLTQLNDLQAQ